jgi:hypothetical protein
MENVVRKIKSTKTRSNTVRIILIICEQNLDLSSTYSPLGGGFSPLKEESADWKIPAPEHCTVPHTLPGLVQLRLGQEFVMPARPAYSETSTDYKYICLKRRIFARQDPQLNGKYALV